MSTKVSQKWVILGHPGFWPKVEKRVKFNTRFECNLDFGCSIFLGSISFFWKFVSTALGIFGLRPKMEISLFHTKLCTTHFRGRPRFLRVNDSHCTPPYRVGVIDFLKKGLGLVRGDGDLMVNYVHF